MDLVFLNLAKANDSVHSNIIGWNQSFFLNSKFIAKVDQICLSAAVSHRTILSDLFSSCCISMAFLTSYSRTSTLLLIMPRSNQLTQTRSVLKPLLIESGIGKGSWVCSSIRTSWCIYRFRLYPSDLRSTIPSKTSTCGHGNPTSFEFVPSLL